MASRRICPRVRFATDHFGHHNCWTIWPTANQRDNLCCWWESLLSSFIAVEYMELKCLWTMSSPWSTVVSCISMYLISVYTSYTTKQDVVKCGSRLENVQSYCFLLCSVNSQGKESFWNLLLLWGRWPKASVFPGLWGPLPLWVDCAFVGLYFRVPGCSV